MKDWVLKYYQTRYIYCHKKPICLAKIFTVHLVEYLQNIITNLLRTAFILLLILLPFVSFDQEDLLPDQNLTLPGTQGVERNPQTLVTKLTENAKTEKESFDLIFTWVVKNIRYDTRAYFSTSGTKIPNVDRILRRKKGICLDYAYLMDTLCKLAGIHNVIVTGYYKDDLFDVNDSIYADNHAWNAVKLNHRWYLYDATMCAGYYTTELRRLSALILKWENKLALKTKQKTKTYKTRRVAECDNVRKKYKVTYEQIPFLKRVLLNILYLKRMRYKVVTYKLTNLNLYLTEPEVFAITHHPDNPYWSLLNKPMKLQDFEKDSAFYHLDKTVYTYQKRSGRICYPCDNYLKLSDVERNVELKNNSLAFNPKNQILPFLCDFEIAEHHYNEALLLVDSLPKIKKLDSTLLFVNAAKQDLSKFSKYLRKESQFHFDKNKTKLVQLRAENKEHTIIINSIVKATFIQARKLKTIVVRNNGLLNYYQQNARKIKNTRVKAIRKGKPKPKEKLKPVEDKLRRLTVTTDSLNQLISTLQDSYIQKMDTLSRKSWKKRRENLRLSNEFYRDAFLRSVYHLDNNKKIIKEHRKVIKAIENSYIYSIQNDILLPADTCRRMNSQIKNLIKARNLLYQKSAKLINTLIAEQIVSADSLIRFKNTCISEIKKNRCWIINNSPLMFSAYDGIRNLGFSEKSILKSIRAENNAELSRFNAIKKEINRRKQRNITIYKNNRLVIVKFYKETRLTKREYLNKLKAARKSKRK